MKRTIRVFLGLFAMLAILSGMWALSCIPSASGVARGIMALPPEATFIGHTIHMDDASVTFRLPPTKSSEDWLRSIAERNGLLRSEDGSYESVLIPEKTSEVIRVWFSEETDTYTAEKYGMRP